MSSFTPRLDKIIEDEESRLHDNNDAIDDSILEEYDFLTEQDLLIALQINPKKYKEGEYLNGISYKKTGEENFTSSEEEDEDDFDGVYIAPNGQNGTLTVNGHNGSLGDFSKLHNGALMKNFEIMERHRTLDGIKSTSIDSMSEAATNDDISSVVSDSSSLSKISKLRNISNRSSNLIPYSHGKELLKKYLSSYEGYEFDSKMGRKIFVKAISKKYMAMYYVISPPQVTAADYENGGISTLLAVRNALKIKDKLLQEDIGHDNESLITSCLIFDYNSNTLNFDEFACIAKLNNLTVEAVVVAQDTDVKRFRSDIKSSCQTDSRICVSHYSANHLFQCAGAYFALVGGYCKEKDLVLLYDASGNKIPPFWIPLTVLFQSIQSKSMDDKNIKEIKLGYYLLEKSEKSPSILLNISRKISVMLNAPDEHYEKLYNMKDDWENWLLSPQRSEQGIIKSAVTNMIEIIKNQTFKNARVREERAKLSYKQGSLVDLLTKTKTFPFVEKFVSSLGADVFSKLTIFSEWVLETVFIMRKSDKSKGKFNTNKKRRKKLVRTNVNMNTFNNATMLATWLLFWPYVNKTDQSNCALLCETIKEDLGIFPLHLVDNFHHQMEFVIRVVESSTMEVVKSKARQNGLPDM